MHINTFLFQRSITSLQKSRRSVYSPSPHMRQKSSPVCEILHANSVLGLYESSKTQVLIVQELFHDPVESSVWRQTHIQWNSGHRMTSRWHRIRVTGPGIRRTNGSGGYAMLFLAPYLQVSPGGSVLGGFCCAAPPGGGSGPLGSFLSLLDPLTLFKVLSPNFSAHDLLHHAGREPASLAIVQPFTQNPACGRERRICHERLERRKTGRRATKTVKQNRAKETT